MNPDKISTELLDQLPFGVTIQNKSRIVLYENKYAKDNFGDFIHKQCYARWSDFDDYGSEICKDCMIDVSEETKQEYTIVRRMVNDNKQYFFKIQHIPFVDNNEDEYRVIEIIQNVTAQFEKKLIDLQIHTQLPNQYNYALLHLGDLGGDLIWTEKIDFLEESIEQFYFKLANYWFLAIGQGENWRDGLFGPLPVLNYLDYSSYVFAFQKKSSNLKDPRHKGIDKVMLMFFVKLGNSTFEDNKSELRVILNKYFDKFTSLEDITPESIAHIRNYLESEVLQLNASD